VIDRDDLWVRDLLSDQDVLDTVQNDRENDVFGLHFPDIEDEHATLESRLRHWLDQVNR